MPSAWVAAAPSVSQGERRQRQRQRRPGKRQMHGQQWVDQAGARPSASWYSSSSAAKPASHSDSGQAHGSRLSSRWPRLPAQNADNSPSGRQG